ncbi:amidohydrolase family protein [Sphingomonas sp. C3-2]|uniref:amidohydrolase family protein n=1 Tax=Sphingomonas sp. C3-2 TaxID=3062169 RepID=UPI00294AF1D3|nr:amidohydrolase family protein [Sphingomonas sp. C3-2]WOK37011.1 amidohydrolase family protein [Sphingomonas sp. C3-2]
MRFQLTTVLALALAAPAVAADGMGGAADKWNVDSPQGATIRQVPIDVTEGTWMNVDVSPDGRTIAFDLLGDIYTMDIAGGTPRRIAEGLSLDMQPRFSPDGGRIAFTSDRGGGENIWVMDRDGSDKRQVTKEDFRLLTQPSWSPDGRFIVARKHFTTGRSLGTGEVWVYHVSGGGGVPLVKKPNEQHQKELGEPVYAPGGKHVYFARNTTPGPIFEYAQDSNNQLFAIERYDLETGEVETIVSGPGGAVRPQPSPDGKWLAFVRREQTRSKLYVKNLQTGEERRIHDTLDQDVQETWAVHGVYPNMGWTPDSRTLVFWAGGKINRIDLASGAVRDIPFHVKDSRGAVEAPRPPVTIWSENVTTSMPRYASVSPDGRQVAFETLGRIWIKDLSGGAARRLTRSDAEREAYPAWSRDGKQIVYVGWTDKGRGTIRTITPSGGSARAVTNVSGHYARPRFSPDGRTIVFEAREGGYLVAPNAPGGQGIFRVAASGGAPVRVARSGSDPQFGASNDRLFMVDSADGKKRLVSTDLNGEARRVHASGELVTAYDVAPSGEYFAFRENYEAYLMPLLPGTQELGTGAKASAMPVARVSRDGADYLSWSGNGTRLHYSLGPTLYSVATDAVFASAPPAADGKPAKFDPPRAGVSLAMTVPADRPTGIVALTGARVVTMGDEKGGVIDNGTIVIDRERIVAVGPQGSVAIPAGAKTLDVTGKTIMPGLVDAHAHGAYGVDDFTPEQNWSAMVNLALGITTTHDPSSSAATVFPFSEMQRAGLVTGPRTFSTGEVIYGAKAPGVYAQIDSLDDARAHLRRLKAQGAHSVKNYNQPRREQRQQIVAAAREEGMRVVAEGGSLFAMDVGHIADGNTTLEHNFPQAVLYKDVIDYFAGSTTGYTPTLVVTYGGPAGDPYWRQATDVWTHPLLQKHEPATILQAANVRRVKAPESDYVDDDNAREAKKLAERGVPVAIGGHGQEPGIAAHWELWSFVRGGMSPVQALRAGTIEAARSLGYDSQIGSLEPGKLADLVILDADPTQDIRNSDKVSKVMLGGRLYDAATLNEEVTGTRRRKPYYWE